MASDMGLQGVFIHKNILGWYAAICVLASAGVLGAGDRRLRRLALLSLLAGLACLAASGSMTGLLSLIAAAGFTLFYTILSRLRGAGRALFVLIALQLVAILAISTTELLVPTLEALGRDATLTGRVPLWRLVDPEIGRHLVLGVGYQAFWTEANPNAWAIWSKVAWQAPHAHSGYRDTLLNFGIVGAAIFAAAIVRAMVQGATLVTQARRDGWLWLNVFAGMFLVMNLTESLFLMQNEFLFVLFATAILMFGLREPELARRRAPEVGRQAFSELYVQ
jgi:exopolysaccharide production protein ExoQ